MNAGTEKNKNDFIIDTAMAAVIKNTPDFMFLKDINSVYITASKPFCDMLGLDSPDEVAGKTDAELFCDAELAKRYLDDDRHLISVGKPIIEYTEPLPSTDGTARYSSTSKYLISDEYGNPVGIFGVGRDITWEYRSKLNYERELSALFELPDDALSAVLLDLTSWRVVDFKLRDDNNRVAGRYETIDEYLINTSESIMNDSGARRFFAEFTYDKLSADFEAGKRSFSFNYERRLDNDETQPVELQVRFLFDPMNDHLLLFSVLRSIKNGTGGRSRSAVDSEDIDEVISLLDSSIPCGLLCARVVKAAGGAPSRLPPPSVFYINDYLLHLIGISRELLDNNADAIISSMIAPEDRDSALSCMREVAETHNDGSVRIRMLRPDGAWLCLYNHVRYLKLRSGAEILVGLITDITDIKRQQQKAELMVNSMERQREELSLAADIDAMTGLFNREATMRNITGFIGGDGRESVHALFMIDIDNFKSVNDMLGHQTGDQALVYLAKAIKSCFRETDIVGRIGGDEFFAFMKNINRISSAQRKAQELIETLQYVCSVGKTQASVSASIGISIYHGDGKPLSELYSEADSALYRAKGMGKNCFMLADDNFTCELAEPAHSLNLFGLHDLLNNIENGVEICHMTPEGNLVSIFVNSGFLSMLGGISHEKYLRIQNEDDYRGVHPDDIIELDAAYIEAKHTNSTMKCSCRLLGADSKYYHVSLVANFIWHKTGGFDVYVIYS